MHNQWTNNYLLHQNIQVMFNICFLLFIIQMFYICPRGHLSQHVIFIVFYCVQCVKFPFTTLLSEGLTERSEHTGNISVWCDVNLYFNKTSDLSVLQTGIFFLLIIQCIFPFNLTSLTSQNSGFLFQCLCKNNGKAKGFLYCCGKMHRISSSNLNIKGSFHPNYRRKKAHFLTCRGIWPCRLEIVSTKEVVPMKTFHSKSLWIIQSSMDAVFRWRQKSQSDSAQQEKQN